MMHTVTHFFLHANPLLIYLTVAVVLMLESSGVPVANNTLLLLTGALASMGHLDIWILGVFAIIGSCAGASLAYSLGAWGGRRILVRVASFFRIKEEKVTIAERWFQQSGVWMIFLSRMTPYVRPFACFPAGISRMPFARFFVSAAAGSVIWCVALLTIGWNLGKRWGLALQAIQNYTVPSLCVVVLLVASYALLLYWLKRHFYASLQSTGPEKGEEAAKKDHNLLGV
ncbi:MAG TPA: DedA family protein [Ktedonosporobacter sp.]|nr:DedA family protein [Ktedonosporobacter sp.]